MANTKPKSGNCGCGVLFVILLALGLVVAIIQGIATGLTNLAVWVIYGPAGLPSDVTRTAVYPLAWSLLGGVAVAIAACVAVVMIERRRLRFFQAAAAGERPPKPPPH